ncbi:unnamed protein product, partial [Durusdinium trenchii]
MRASPVMKKDIYKTMKKIPVHKSSLKKCPCCQNNLSRKKEYSVVQARLFSSESITTIASQGLYCGRNRCKLYFRHNFVWLGGQKINCMSFNEMKKNWALLCHLQDCLHHEVPRAVLSSPLTRQDKVWAGSGSSPNRDDTDMFWGHSSFRDHLLHALEGYALARRDPTKVIEALLSPVEPGRQVKLKGRPMKRLYEHDRSCHCKQKDAVRHVLPDRTAGWQFAIDPATGQVLGAYEHVVNERNEDKVALLKKVLAMPLVSADLLLHDDACHFEAYVQKHAGDAFDGVKYYLVD